MRILEFSVFCGMTIFLDTEFTGLQQSAQLISLALVSMDGQWFYAEFTDYDTARLSDWHKEHVIAHLLLKNAIEPAFAGANGYSVRGITHEIVPVLKEWLERFVQIEIWADVLAYDWVLFCELFGGSLYLPKQVSYIPHDFSTLLKIRGLDPNIPRESLVQEWVKKYNEFKHNALYDAYLLRAAYQNLI